MSKDIADIAFALECTVDWRRQKAVEHPDDERTLEAAILLEKIATELRSIETGALAQKVRLYLQAPWSEDPEPEVDEFRRSIGFHSWPANASEYLEELARLSA